jgi:hypothetical protein
MFESPVEELTATDTLAFLRDRRAAADAEEAKLLAGVAHWADLHPSVHPDHDPDYWCLDDIGAPGTEREVRLAGDGTPPVAEFALADLATTLRLSAGATRQLVGDTLELRHRLPLCWDRVHAGRLQAWRARRIAQHTTDLTPQAAAWVDRQVAPIAHKITRGRLQRLIHADLDGPDARRLDATLDRGADALAALGDTRSHDVRRATALGILADPQAALDLLAGREPTTKTNLVLYVHLNEATLAGDRGTAHVQGLPGLPGLHALPLQTIRDWAATANIVVKPVIDGNADLVAPGYTPTAAQREQILLRDPTCVFPWCDTPGRHHDLDHIDPYDEHGPPDQTRSSNLARLCRYHHRVKTHGHWRYQRHPDGSYHWTSPHGHTYRVDTTGTTAL